MSFFSWLVEGYLRFQSNSWVVVVCSVVSLVVVGVLKFGEFQYGYILGSGMYLGIFFLFGIFDVVGGRRNCGVDFFVLVKNELDEYKVE